MAVVMSTRKSIKTELQLKKLKATGKSYDVRVPYSSGLNIRVDVSEVNSSRWDRGSDKQPWYVSCDHSPVIKNNPGSV